VKPRTEGLLQPRKMEISVGSEGASQPFPCASEVETLVANRRPQDKDSAKYLEEEELIEQRKARKAHQHRRRSESSILPLDSHGRACIPDLSQLPISAQRPSSSRMALTCRPSMPSTEASCKSPQGNYEAAESSGGRNFNRSRRQSWTSTLVGAIKSKLGSSKSFDGGFSLPADDHLRASRMVFADSGGIIDMY
jgi:hypothetical protein